MQRTYLLHDYIAVCLEVMVGCKSCEDNDLLIEILVDNLIKLKKKIKMETTEDINKPKLNEAILVVLFGIENSLEDVNKNLTDEIFDFCSKYLNDYR